jgi:tetratricopeptide (TPR) repeat protein
MLGRTDEAIVEYREAIKVNSGFAPAHFGLGVVLAATGKPDEAISEYREALRIKPDYAEARTNLDALLAQRGRTGG